MYINTPALNLKRKRKKLSVHFTLLELLYYSVKTGHILSFIAAKFKYFLTLMINYEKYKI